MSTTTTEIDALCAKAKQHTEWLREFQEAHWETRAIFRELDYLIDACYTVGNDRMGDTLNSFSDALQQCVKTMDQSVSRGIHEQAQESWNGIGDTLAALLGMVTDDGSTQPRKDGEG